MLRQNLRRRAACAGTLLSAAFALPVLAVAQTTAAVPRQTAEPAVLSLAPQSHTPRAALAKGEPSYENAPANFHAFASAKVGHDAGVETLTLNIASSTTLTKIASASKDFLVESGGSCQEGKGFSQGESCTLLVRFTPQGAGSRGGKIIVENSASAQPFAIGMGGYGYAPVVSFAPAVITTLAGTYPSNTGLFSSATGLAIDNNDTLYVADTGNNAIRYFDSSQTWRSLVSGSSVASPLGVTTDTFGEVYYDLSGSNTLYEIYDYGPSLTITGSGTANCTSSAPCPLSSEALISPGPLSTDGNNNLFFADDHNGAAMVTAQPVSASVAFLYDPFPFQESITAPIGVDTSDNLYTPWQDGGTCSIIKLTLYNAENSISNFTKIAGGHTCGFSGDGGQAGNAEISSRTGGIVFDLAGNLYFTDTANQRVRRIDEETGQIHTIAGNGTAGYTGDGGPATSAELYLPTGLGIDSQGQVYILSRTGSTGAGVIRQVTTQGILTFPTISVGTTSPAQIMTVENTGNSDLNLTNAIITGTNPGDFAIDPTTTSCQLTAGSYLASGSSCKIGVLFTPAASGPRSAILVFLDNTVNGSNTVQLVANPQAAVSLSPSSIAFSSITAGTSANIPVMVTNSGFASLAVSGITFTGTNASSFGHSSNCGQAQIAPGGTCTITVIFSPSSAGSYSATMNITDNAANSPQSVSITGSASAAADVPSAHIIKAPVDRPAPRMNLETQQ